MVLGVNAANFENVFESWTEIARGKSFPTSKFVPSPQTNSNVSPPAHTRAHTGRDPRGAAF